MRGAPRIESEARTVTLHVRVTPTLADQIAEARGAIGLSEFVRGLLRAATRGVSHDHEAE